MRKICIVYGGKALELIESISPTNREDAIVEVLEYAETKSSDLERCEILWTKLHPKVDEKLLRELPNLKIVVSPTTGLGHINQEALKKSNIRLISLRNFPEITNQISSTAEFTLGLILCVWRQIVLASQSDFSLEASHLRENFFGQQIKGRKIGIVGLGRVGNQLASYVKALGLTIIFHDPRITFSERFGHSSDLDSLCREVDILAITASVEDPNIPIISRSHIFMMKQGSILINTARGSLVDEEALAEALAKRKLSGAGIDVMQHEDLFQETRKSPLLSIDRSKVNLVLTPHIAGASSDALQFINRELFDIVMNSPIQ